MRYLTSRLSIAIAIGATLLLSAAQSNAEPTKPTKPREVAKVEKADKGYAYTFGDDPLAGISGGANIAVIKVFPRGMRRTLIRPRLSFVPEMLKSVENI